MVPKTLRYGTECYLENSKIFSYVGLLHDALSPTCRIFFKFYIYIYI